MSSLLFLRNIRPVKNIDVLHRTGARTLQSAIPLQSGSHRKSFDHAGRVGRIRSCNGERRAVIGRGAHDG